MQFCCKTMQRKRWPTDKIWLTQSEILYVFANWQIGKQIPKNKDTWSNNQITIWWRKINSQNYQIILFLKHHNKFCNMTDQMTAEMRSEATRELNGMKFRKANVTKYVKKCVKLVEVFEENKLKVLLRSSAKQLQMLWLFIIGLKVN